MNKLKSRKFWLSVAAFLASIGASIAGLTTDNKYITVAGVVCTMLSAAIYAAAEAYADGNRPPIDYYTDNDDNKIGFEIDET